MNFMQRHFSNIISIMIMTMVKYAIHTHTHPEQTPWSSTTHRKLGPTTSVINKENDNWPI